MNSLHSSIGGTKIAEYVRSAELFEQITKEQGAYFALAFLIDSGYARHDLKAILERINPIRS